MDQTIFWANYSLMMKANWRTMMMKENDWRQPDGQAWRHMINDNMKWTMTIFIIVNYSWLFSLIIVTANDPMTNSNEEHWPID